METDGYTARNYDPTLRDYGIDRCDIIEHNRIPGMIFHVVNVIVSKDKSELKGVEVSYTPFKNKTSSDMENLIVLTIPADVLKSDFSRYVSKLESIS